jgi:hypothetical protein
MGGQQQPADGTAPGGFHPSADTRLMPPRQDPSHLIDSWNGPVMRAPRPLLLALLFPVLTGCGLLGGSWDVRMEVQGSGTAAVTTKFAGEPDAGTTTAATLPFSTARNVGFGFNRIDVHGAAPGTACRVLVDGAVREEHAVDAAGNASCTANNQNP